MFDQVPPPSVLEKRAVFALVVGSVTAAHRLFGFVTGSKSPIREVTGDVAVSPGKVTLLNVAPVSVLRNNP